jgi:hypothetical protein
MNLCICRIFVCFNFVYSSKILCGIAPVGCWGCYIFYFSPLLLFVSLPLLVDLPVLYHFHFFLLPFVVGTFCWPHLALKHQIYVFVFVRGTRFSFSLVQPIVFPIVDYPGGGLTLLQKT